MNRRERKKEETRENIISTAIQFFRKKGFEATSMEEIAEMADISKGTLYNYFSDKESILVGYYQSSVAKYGQEFIESLQNVHGIETRLNKFLDFINWLLSQDLDIATIYFKYRLNTLLDYDPFHNPRRSGLEHILLKIMQEAQESKEIRDDLPALILSRNFQFLLRSYLIANVYTKESIAMESSKDQLIGLFLNGAKG